MKFKEIAIKKIKAKDNVREDISKTSIEGLVQSIKEQGMLQPILVKINKDGYDLIAGFRRLAAAKALKLESVPCVIEDIDEKDRKQVQLVENIQREDLNPVDEAIALSDLLKTNKIDDLAMMIGKTKKFVSDRIKVLSLPMLVTDALRSKKITIGHAIVIARIPNKKGQIEMCKDILSDRMSVATAESNLNNFSKRLEYAPFDRTGCKGCVYNGVNIKDLFDKDVELKGQCMNPECFDKKVKEHIVVRKAYWKEKKISVMTKDQYHSNDEYNKWKHVQNYEVSTIGKDAYKEEMKKGENVMVVIGEEGREELYIKKSVWNTLAKRNKLPAGKSSKGGIDPMKQQRDKVKQDNRVDETKRRFLIARLEKAATETQLDRIILEILFGSEHGTDKTIAGFLFQQGLIGKTKKENENFEVRYNIDEMLCKARHSAIVKEQSAVANRAIKHHDTDYLVAMGTEVKVNMSQFRIDEEYLGKITKDGLLKLVKEFKIKTPDKFESKSKGDMVKWILEQKINQVPKELLK